MTPASAARLGYRLGREIVGGLVGGALDGLERRGSLRFTKRGEWRFSPLWNDGGIRLKVGPLRVGVDLARDTSRQRLRSIETGRRVVASVPRGPRFLLVSFGLAGEL